MKKRTRPKVPPRGTRPAPPNTAAARRRLLDAQARRLERHNRVADGEVLEVSAVLATWQEILGTIRARLLAMPSALAPTLAAESNPLAVYDRLMEHVRDALQELSTWRPPAGPSEAP